MWLGCDDGVPLSRERSAVLGPVQDAARRLRRGRLWRPPGQPLRAALCRALIHEPQLLMLDEPFGALDAFTREELWQVIRDLHAETGVTVVLVTHDLREAVFLADRVFVMSARPGRVLAEREIALPRPRSLEVTYEADFQALVHELRAHIVTARQ